MSRINLPTALRMLARVSDLHTPNRDDLRTFLLDATDGNFTFTNDLGETYTLRQQNSIVTLHLPDGDNSGDPGVVTAFNKALA